DYAINHPEEIFTKSLYPFPEDPEKLEFIRPVKLKVKLEKIGTIADYMDLADKSWHIFKTREGTKEEIETVSTALSKFTGWYSSTEDYYYNDLPISLFTALISSFNEAEKYFRHYEKYNPRISIYFERGGYYISWFPVAIFDPREVPQSSIDEMNRNLESSQLLGEGIRLGSKYYYNLRIMVSAVADFIKERYYRKRYGDLGEMKPAELKISILYFVDPLHNDGNPTIINKKIGRLKQFSLTPEQQKLLKYFIARNL
uniref:hypothetical protein n=1 Tax=Ferroglobus sp. TaxID=2614230 RepID=UPI0025B938E3